jgi:hypothetical protein
MMQNQSQGISQFGEISPGEIARFQALMSLAANDSQLIWSRYYSLLTANAIVAVVIGALAARNFDKTVGAVLLVLSVFGLLLTWTWKQLTRRGWELEHGWVAAAKQVSWGDKPSPFAPYSEWCKTSGCGEGTKDWIARYALRVCNLFLFAYAGAAVFVIVRLVV